jgi:6-phosphogluconolactonase/glucosamine-6-phosphate isomerase/deaminase
MVSVEGAILKAIMQFAREQQSAAVHAIAEHIVRALRDGQRVLWLVSGGSNIAAEVAVMDRIRADAPARLPGLAIMPMDERFGPSGHAHSNTQGLRQAGFDPGAAVWVDVLAHNVTFEQTVSFYNEVAGTLLGNAGIVIGQFGLGADGHVAGILPHSPSVDADEVMVAGYEWSDFPRLTLTPTALKQITTGYVLAYGSVKQRALERLQKHTELLDDLPAVLLYDIPEVHVYMDTEATKEDV